MPRHFRSGRSARAAAAARLTPADAPSAQDAPAPTAAATFRSLGTTVVVRVREAGDLADAEAIARRVLVEVDASCSRHREDSDLTRVNRRPGQWVEADVLLVAAVEAALEAARATDGLVHPLLGLPEAPAAGSWGQVVTDPAGAVRIPAGTALDLGATVKAWAADLVAAGLDAQLAGSALVAVGHDLRVAAPDGRPWGVGLAERPGRDPEEVVSVTSGGVATSTTRVRRWTRAGVAQHHLLDPRTGQPAAEVWRTVTTTGATCTAAHTASTAAVVLGHAAPAWLEGHGVPARLVASDGAVRRLGTWPVPDRSAA